MSKPKSKEKCVNGCLGGQVSISVDCPCCEDPNSISKLRTASQMLEALELVDRFHNKQADTELLVLMLRKVTKAIAKAKGE